MTDETTAPIADAGTTLPDSIIQPPQDNDHVAAGAEPFPVDPSAPAAEEVAPATSSSLNSTVSADYDYAKMNCLQLAVSCHGSLPEIGSVLDTAGRFYGFVKLAPAA